MGKILNTTLAFTLSATALLTSSCDEGCTESIVSFAITDLIKQDFSSPTISAVQVTAIDFDTIVVKPTADLELLEIVLNPDTTFTNLLFDMQVGEDVIRDTVTITYEPIPYFLSVDCGCSYFFNIDTITHTNNLIKGYEIINESISNEKKPNIAIIY